MSQLSIFYDNLYQSISIDDKKELTLGNELHHTITVQSIKIEPVIQFVKNQTAEVIEIYQNSELIDTLIGTSQTTLSVAGQEILINYESENHRKKINYYIGDQNEFFLPNKKDRKISFFYDKDNWFVQSFLEDVYLNGKKTTQKTPIGLGDILLIDNFITSLTKKDILTIESKYELDIPLIKINEPSSTMKSKYPNYRRTPRMIYELPDTKIDFSLPTEEPDSDRRSLLLIIAPPLVMLMVMGVVSIIQPRGIFILISLAMFTMTIITSTIQYFKEKKKQKKQNKKRIQLYTAYLESKRDELYNLAEKQRTVLYYHFPSFDQIKYLTSEVSNRIWERHLTSHDFLHFRVGRADVSPTFQIAAQEFDASTKESDDLLEKAQSLLKYYKKVKNVPLVVNLATGAIGLIGKESIVKKEIQQIVGQLSFFHSYHDVRMIAIFEEADYSNWEWMKWLPHFQLPHRYARGFIYNEKTRDQLLTSIYEIIKERKNSEKKKEKREHPHFVFIITNRQLISEHAILEYLEGEYSDLGISVIFAAETKENLTDNIYTLVRYIDDEQGEILIENKKATQLSFHLDEQTQNGNESFSRMLLSLNHQLGMSQSIPEKVTFLEMFETKTVEGLQVMENWKTNQSSKSLAVPVGLKGKSDLVYLNLHEKAHGPHGLLAGTTGSGKSEFLQTYILSLAIQFHPHEVAFLLIDYKGGGMAQPFKDIPHLLGTITNIEGSRNFSKRALASIKSELERRQRLFDQFKVNHISDYTELYSEGVTKLPLPHLFLISDEFAELKNEEPEFIAELVSAARIGRSLGVHLILATQKPGGIIDDQIWSNSRFKVALRVQDESDSKEILKNSDAASLTITGRGYLQVGNNEVYELFQSAWSGAPYVDETSQGEDTISLVTDLGLVPLSNVSAEKSSSKKDKRTEIDLVVEEIKQVQEGLDIQPVPSPWLPPLPEQLAIENMKNHEEHHYNIALVDEPEIQRQRPYSYVAMKDGNVGIFGSSGYGKSTTILTLLLNFALNNTPEEYQFYIFDFGNGALLPLASLPHTGDYFRADEQRKIEKFLYFIENEMNTRKELFRDNQVSNIQMYNRIANNKLPLLFIVIDNYDLVRDEMFEIEEHFNQIARDGQSLGIYIIITATRVNAVRHALMSNLKTKILHYLLDETEKRTLIGRTDYETEAIPGRAYIQTGHNYLAQIYLPVSGKDDLEIRDQLKEMVQELKTTYKMVEKPMNIPMLPEKLTLQSYVENYELEDSNSLLAIGLEEYAVKPVYIDWDRHHHLLVVGEPNKGKTNLLKVIISQLKESSNVKIALHDSINLSLNSYSVDDQVIYLNGSKQIEEWIESTESQFSEREKEYQKALEERRLKDLDLTPYVLIIHGFTNFQQSLDTQLQTKLSNLIKNYSHLGLHLIITGAATDISKGYDAFTNEIKQIKHAVLLGKKNDQNLFTLPYERNEEELKVGFGYYIKNGEITKIQIPRFSNERT